MSKIGPFFYIHQKLIYNACSLDKGRQQADKLDNSYCHEKLFDSYFATGDYIDYPRGRVVWDKTKSCSIIYIDPCINCKAVLQKIIIYFELKKYIVEFDDHYHCKNCVNDLFK